MRRPPYSGKDVQVSFNGQILTGDFPVVYETPAPATVPERRLEFHGEVSKRFTYIAEALKSITLGPAWPLDSVTVQYAERRLRENETQIALHFSFRVIDRDTGDWTTVGITQALTNCAEREQADLAQRAIDMAFHELGDMLRHELCESFRVKGELYKDPHAKERREFTLRPLDFKLSAVELKDIQIVGTITV